MNIALGALAGSFIFTKQGNSAWIPVTEWALGLLIINYFAFVSFDTDYYETVEPIEKKE